ncbi:MAG: hypothetical protein ABSG41_10040 [Bryobacteraceae bacterium]
MHTDRLARSRAVIPNAPDIASEIASALAVPFERLPFFGAGKVCKHKTLELETVEILEMNRLYVLGRLTHIFCFGTLLAMAANTSTRYAP